MCIILHKPQGVKLDPVIYKNCFNRNDHGAGLAYVKDDKLVVDKGYDKLEAFVSAVKKVEDLELVIHCRLMSKGEISDENCHPFLIGSETFPHMSFAIAHNGTLTWRSTDQKSDTRYFVEDAIQVIVDGDPYFFEYPIKRAMMASYVGSNNKFCVMRYDSAEKKTDVFFINRNEGIEYGGCWFSNLSFTDEQSRYILEADRKRILTWKPTLFQEKKALPYSQPYVPGPNGRDDLFRDDDVGVGKDWVHDTSIHFGWYCKDPKYTGRRTLKEFQDAQKAAGVKPGDDKDKDHEPMDYLSPDEKKQARKLCQEIVKDSFPSFKFNGVSTNEVCAWARGELRGMIPGLRDYTNQELMNHILYGEGVKTDVNA